MQRRTTRNIILDSVIMGSSILMILVTCLMLPTANQEPVEETGNAGDEAFISAAEENCAAPAYCTLWVRDAKAQLTLMRDRQAVRAIEIQLPRDSPMLSVGNSMCSYQDCEIMITEGGMTIRQQGRKVITLLRNDVGQYSTNVLAPAMASE